MTAPDPHLIVRAAAVYLCAVLTVAVWLWRRPGPRAVAGAALASLWNVPALLLLHVAAARWGWWRFDAIGGTLLGMPVDLYLAWIWLWGVIPALALPAWPIAAVLALALLVDLVLMPAAAPVVRLGPWWLVGEAAGLLGALLPAQLLARWTTRDEHLGGRVALQAMAFGGLLVLVLPAIVVEGSGGMWRDPRTRSVWQVSLLVQALAVPAILGLSAVQEFATRGGGTPVPFDPPKRLVTTGAYAYVRNPMQLSAVVLLLLLGLMLQNAWLAAAGVMAHIYSVGLAGWDEDDDLRGRFGDRWTAYRGGVRRWILRWRPWHPPDRPVARLFVSEQCGMCREVGRWLAERGVRGMAIAPAEGHPSGTLTRITYQPADGSRPVSGIEAVARALEHTHLGWAFGGFVLRLPVVLPLAQLIVDASGGGPRVLRPAGLVCSPMDHRHV